MEAFEQAVERGVAGSGALEDAVEAGAQDLGLFEAGGELVVFQATIEPPDHPLGDLDGVALFVVGGDELVNEPLGVNPAQRVDADAKLAGVVGNDDRVLQQALMMDRAPQRRLVGDQDGIGQDFHLAQGQRLQMALPVARGGKNARLMRGELVDHDLRQVAPFHIVDRRVVDDVERRSTAKPRQKRQARFRGSSAKRREVGRADLRRVGLS